jgi:hypothetical protein
MGGTVLEGRSVSIPRGRKPGRKLNIEDNELSVMKPVKYLSS